jgi:hypothetical protein
MWVQFLMPKAIVKASMEASSMGSCSASPTTQATDGSVVTHNDQVPGYTLERSQCQTSTWRTGMGAVPVLSVYPRAMPRSLPTASMDGLMSHTVTEDDAR